MRMLARAEWGATVPTSTKLMVLPARGVHVHHSVTRVTGDPAADMREIEAIGRRRFGRFPYSFCLHPSGVVCEGAGLSVGAHTEGWNSTTFGVCLIGNYENDVPTDAQVQAFGELYRWLVGNGWLVPGAWIEPHRARKATACPGGHTIGRWNDLIAATQEDDMGQLDGEQRDWLFEIYQAVRRRDYDGDGRIDTPYLMDAVVGLREQLDPRGEGTIRDALLTIRDELVAAVAAATIDVDALAAKVAAKVGAGPVNLQVSGAELTAVVKGALKDALREGTGA